MNSKMNRHNNRLRYHLRFQIAPFADTVKDAHTLSRFCKRHKIEEVILFFAGEEWNNGLLSGKEEDKWFEVIRKAKAILDKNGISVSLNPWMTVLHCDRGRVFPEDRKFKPMVSPAGEACRACASFADKKWQEYIFDLYGRFAKLGFRVIWVEDDFRYHNHAPLTWGGGFEDEVIKLFEKKIGRKTNRKEVIKNIFRPGKPHPWRALWMETWRELQINVAKGLADSVGRNSGQESMLGLMSSLPGTHSQEGRNWQALFDALSIKGQMVHRPHYASYGETTASGFSYPVAMLDLQKTFRPANCEVAPEVENFPFTRWNKPDCQTWAEMALCLFNGSDALLLDLFPFVGNPADAEPQIGGLLDKSRSSLEWIKAGFPRSLQTTGVCAPWKQDAQAHVRTTCGKSMDELDASSLPPSFFLLPYGIPTTANSGQSVNAVFGSLAWAFSDSEIMAMLSKGLMLDGESAKILCERGFSRLIGVDVKDTLYRERSKYSIEVAKSQKTGLKAGFYMSVNLLDRMMVVEPHKTTEEWSMIISSENKRIGSGLSVFRNPLGGKVAVFAMPRPQEAPRLYQRQIMIQNLVRHLAGRHDIYAMSIGAPFMIPLCLTGDGAYKVVILNSARDPEFASVMLNGTGNSPDKAFILEPLTDPRAVKFDSASTKQGILVTSREKINPLSFMVLEWTVRQKQRSS